MTRATLLADLRSVVALAMCVGLCACGSTAPAASPAFEDTSANRAAAGPIAVSPQPGTPDASPSTQISFLGPQGTHVAGVHVVGTHSGAHAGVLRAYSTGTGESFLPAHRFAAGERVSVSARVSAGSASYAVSTSFTVAHQARVSEKEFPLNPGNAGEVQHYSSAPTLTPSTVRISTQAKPGAAPGDLLLAPYQGKGTAGPMITEQNGNLVWFRPLPAGVEATSLKVQQYEGKTVLTWWQGRILEVGFGVGEDVIYNSAYQKVASVRAGNGYQADLHEFRLAPDGSAWIDAVRSDRHEPRLLRGQGRGRRQRFRGRADRREDGPGDVAVARARTHPDRRIAQAKRRNRATRGTTCTSTPSIRGGPATCCCPRATPGGCMTSTSTAAPCAGASVDRTRASSSDRERARTGSTTRSGSREG